MPKIDKIPGAFWVALIGGITAVVTVYLTAQYPDNAPAWVAAALAACSVAVGLAKVLWPTSATTPLPTQDGLPLPAGAAMGDMSQATAQRPSAVRRFLF